MHQTPEWLDDVLDRREISFDEYSREMGFTSKQYWVETWRLAETERISHPARSLIHALFKWLFG